MSNTKLTADVIARQALDILKNKLQIGNKVYRAYEPEWRDTVNGYKKGETVRIRKPARFIANDGADVTSAIQDFTETSVDLTVDQRHNVAWQFSSTELTLDISEYSERVLAPAIHPLREKIDTYLASLHTQMNYAVGTTGTTPSTFDNLLAIQEKFDNISAPEEDRCAFFNPAARRAIVNGMKGAFQEVMVGDWLKKAAIGHLAGVDMFTSTFVNTFDPGTNDDITTVTVNDGAIAAGDTSLTFAGFGNTKTIKAGTIFTIADVYAVDYVTKETKDDLMQFVTTADHTTTGGAAGAATLAFSPALNSTANGFQNIDALPVTGAAVTVLTGTTGAGCKANFAFTKQSIALACVPLDMPDSVVWGARETSEDGLSIRITKGFNILTDVEIIRADILFGAKVIYPETCMRVLG
jgi:hypothetical protein